MESFGYSCTVTHCCLLGHGPCYFLNCRVLLESSPLGLEGFHDINKLSDPSRPRAVEGRNRLCEPSIPGEAIEGLSSSEPSRPVAVEGRSLSAFSLSKMLCLPGILAVDTNARVTPVAVKGEVIRDDSDGAGMPVAHLTLPS